MYGNNYGYYNPYYQSISGGQSGGQPIAQMNQPIVQSNIQSRQLNGKLVDSVDVVKAIDIPLDGSLSFFPLTDGSAIVTKKLGNNGTSEIQVYKPVKEEQKEDKKDAFIPDDFIKKLDKLDNSEALETLLDEIQDIKKEIKEIKVKSKGKEN